MWQSEKFREQHIICTTLCVQYMRTYAHTHKRFSSHAHCGCTFTLPLSQAQLQHFMVNPLVECVCTTRATLSECDLQHFTRRGDPADTRPCATMFYIYKHMRTYVRALTFWRRMGWLHALSSLSSVRMGSPLASDTNAQINYAQPNDVIWVHTRLNVRNARKFPCNL